MYTVHVCIQTALWFR